MAIKVLYRISDGGNPKVKLSNASKKACLENAGAIFGHSNITLFADNCGNQTLEMVQNLGFEPHLISLGNAMSWRHVAEFGMKSFPDDQIIYLLEDDYFHLPQSASALEEGLEIGEYVTLYDHPDKYMSMAEGGSNPYVEGGSENTKVWLSKTCHWKQTNSTTMTFATRVKTLKSDWPIWIEFTSQGFPNDFGAFQRLQGLGTWENKIFGPKHRLISSIPGLSTHAETAWLSPHTDWSAL